MGTGKILIQAFLQFKNLRYIYGVELSEGRYRVAEEAVLRMVDLLGYDNYHVQINPGRFVMVTEVVRNYGQKLSNDEFVERVLHFQCGNMFDTPNIHTADIVMMETDVPVDTYPSLLQLLNKMKVGSRLLTYLDIRRLWDGSANFPFRQREVNRNLSDRYPTSWSVQRGHHFYLWSKVFSPLLTHNTFPPAVL